MGIGGKCGPEGDATNNIKIKNITFRRLKGTVQRPGALSCRKGTPLRGIFMHNLDSKSGGKWVIIYACIFPGVGNPCTVTFEDVELETTMPWSCGNAHTTR